MSRFVNRGHFQLHARFSCQMQVTPEAPLQVPQKQIVLPRPSPLDTKTTFEFVEIRHRVVFQNIMPGLYKFRP